MSYDKYRNWPLPFQQGIIFPPPSPETKIRVTIENQVLKDLEATEDPIEKLEILDSYATYAQRSYRAELAEQLSASMGQQLRKILEPAIANWFPEIRPTGRARVGKPVEKSEK